ncbi:MAG TPA: DUF4870 domain-containing protein [Haloplasmataceae bacterium]
MREYRYDPKSQSYVPSDEGHSSQDRVMGILAWVITFFTGTILPLAVSALVMAYYKERNAYLHEVWKQSLNYQLSLIVYSIVATIAGFILTMTILLIPLVFVIALGILAYQIVIPILGIIEANRLRSYFPHFAIPFLN